MSEICYCDFYRPQRSCGQGNIFTPVCHSVHGGGVCLSACWDTTPPPSRPPEQSPPPSRPPSEQTPPGKQTPVYGQRAAGTHPTGMHSCSIFVIICTFRLIPRTGICLKAFCIKKQLFKTDCELMDREFEFWQTSYIFAKLVFLHNIQL